MRQLFDAEGYSDDWIMVTGNADDRDASPVPYSSTTGFNVERVYRGHAPERIVLIDAEDGVSCGMTVEAGGRQFVVARLEGDGVYEPTFCGSFTITPALQAELDAASDGSAPVAVDGIAADDSGASDLRLLALASALGMLVVFLAVLMLLRQRKTRQ